MSLKTVQRSRYDAPRLSHEWWRDTLPTVPVTPDWNATISCLEQVDAGVSLVVLDGVPGRCLHLPAPDAAVFGMQIWLTAGATVQVDHAHVCSPMADDVVLFDYAGDIGSLACIPAGQPVHMVDIRFTAAALSERGAHGLRAALSERCTPALSRPERGAFVTCLASPPGLLSLARSMAGCPRHDLLARRLWWQSRCLDALSIAAELLGDDVPPAITGDAHQAALRAERLLLQRYDEDWTAHALARSLRVSEKRLQHAFREIVGMTVNARLRTIRLNVAAAMLADGRRVTDVAADVGYASLSHFSQSFRAHFGRSPHRWRASDAIESPP